MTKVYPISMTIELNNADFDKILENFEESLNTYLYDEFDLWNNLDDSAKESLTQTILKDLAQQILNKDLT